MTCIKDMINSPLIYPPFPESKGIVQSLLTFPFVFFHIFCLWIGHIRRVYDGLIFYLLSVIVLEVTSSDLFCLIVISYLACRIGPVKVPLCLALSIVVHLTHCCQLHLPRAWNSHAQKQANKCPQKFNVYFLLPFCLGNEIQTV